MKTKLLAVDLDGTLLDKQSSLLDRYREALLEAQARGVEVIIVTGRSWRATRAFYEALALKGPAICYLGALVVADGTGRVLHHRPLQQQAWAQLRTLALAEGIAITVCIGADQHAVQGTLPNTDLMAADTAFATKRADDFTDWVGWNLYTDISLDLSAVQVDAPTMVAVYGDEAVRRVRNAFPVGLPDSQFDLTDKVAGETVLHVWHQSVDKGRALADFCRVRGIRPHEVAAIGDAPMDISMVRFAGLGAAVPSAHPALKACAKLVMEPDELVRRILDGKGAR